MKIEDNFNYKNMIKPIFIDFKGSENKKDPIPLRVAFGVEKGAIQQYLINPYCFKGFKETDHYSSLLIKQFLTKAKVRGLHPLAVCQKILAFRNMRLYAEDNVHEQRMLERLMRYSGETIKHGIEIKCVFKDEREHVQYFLENLKVKGVFQDSAFAVEMMIKEHKSRAMKLELDILREERLKKDLPPLNFFPA